MPCGSCGKAKAADGQLIVPSKGKQAWSYMKAMARSMISGLSGKPRYVSEDQLRIRLEICEANTCGMRVGRRCYGCDACWLDEVGEGIAKGAPGKAQYTTEDCPKGLWPKLN